MAEERVKLSSGSLRLEGIIHLPPAAGRRPAVLLCHPHPLYGGDMGNNVVVALAAELARRHIVALRFNFRGVGVSEGSFAQGKGEVEDALAALAYLAAREESDPQALSLAGYSFGAFVGLKAAAEDPRVRALAAIAPPLAYHDFSFLKRCAKPKFFLGGDADQYLVPAALAQFVADLPPPAMHEIVAGADHFWWGYEAEAARRVADFFQRTLGREAALSP